MQDTITQATEQRSFAEEAARINAIDGISRVTDVPVMRRTPTLRPLDQQVIVITGASSGIGLATAQAAARAGARVVLASRSGEALRDIARELEAEGAEALAVEVDVGQPADVQRLLDEAVGRFGRVDTWVNNAAVDIWGRIEEVSDEDSRRLFETNFWGTVYGSKIAAAHLKSRGGAIINVGSIAGDRAFPLQGMYCASKHAVKAFTDALRSELAAEGAPVSVTQIKPASVGSPLQGHARNYLRSEPRLPSPLYEPEAVAEAILHAAENPRRDIYVGGAGRVLSAVGMLLPRLSDLAARTVLIASQKRGVPASARWDNLYAAGPSAGIVQSDPEGRRIRPSLYTRASLHPAATAAIATGAALGLWAVLRSLKAARR
jgi:NADP-dependent 3-hydroxy acid dehydrogenase YdfG